MPAPALRLSPSPFTTLAVPHDIPPNGHSVAKLREAEILCRRLAKTHYENFLVGSFFIPRRFRQPFYNLYAFCRTADDLADETASPEEALGRLDRWEEELETCFAGNPRHPIFIALADTVQRFELAKQPFLDLLSAFRQDQQVTQYATFDDLLDYCRRSANPVGRMVLDLAAIDDPQQLAWSDSICTGLQLANFWQDIRRDAEIGRCYIPREDFFRFGVEPRGLSRMPPEPLPLDLVRFQVERTESFFTAGLPLADHVPGWLARDVRMFVAGGRAVLDAIRKQHYDVWERRPIVSKRKQMGLMLRVAMGKQI